ncbi:TPR repeat-containing protein YrrB [Kordia antarctica]|uniref:TPR repeat-containing protein YrrB n=1 Tax=Kordia antarctica TaxID=1218801 RepID=A0A7L4ZEV0_9FLAO|nr:M50 family metallopeptidase [Kordia antarctica]QHI35097.1 TPR repeat-containing protein YrrB [Kordia antarctica]
MHQEYIIVFAICLLVFQRLIIIIHEFGHAISALLNSTGKVTVYLGSYGDEEKSFRFKIKRLECFFKYNIFAWKGGLCVPHGKNVSWKSSVLISVFGPLTTLLLGSITCIVLLFFEINLLAKMILFAFAFSCILDFIFNIIPRKRQIKLHDGSFVYNDGKRLTYLWSIRNMYDEMNEAMTFYNEKNYAKAADLFEECLTKAPENQELYRLMISSYLQIKNYNKAGEFQKVYTEKYKNSFDLIDYVNLGVLQINEDDLQKALDSFNKALNFDPKHQIVLCNRGLTYGLLDRHEEAITDLNKAISIDPNFQYAWDNLGFSKLKLGQLEEGYADLQKALELDDQDPYVHRNFGIYYFYKKDYQKALSLYEKALKLDPDGFKIQEYIDEVKAVMNS